MRFVNRSTCVPLGAPGELTQNLNHQKLEAASLSLGMPSSHSFIRIQCWICHPFVHASVGKGGYAEDAATLCVDSAQLTIYALAFKGHGNENLQQVA
jgi:hypothetical protein